GAGNRLRAVPDGFSRRALLAGLDLAASAVRDERRVFDALVRRRRLRRLDHDDNHWWRRVPGGAEAREARPAAADDSGPAADDSGPAADRARSAGTPL